MSFSWGSSLRSTCRSCKNEWMPNLGEFLEYLSLNMVGVKEDLFLCLWITVFLREKGCFLKALKRKCHQFYGCLDASIIPS